MCEGKTVSETHFGEINRFTQIGLRVETAAANRASAFWLNIRESIWIFHVEPIVVVIALMESSAYGFAACLVPPTTSVVFKSYCSHWTWTVTCDTNVVGIFSENHLTCKHANDNQFEMLLMLLWFAINFAAPTCQRHRLWSMKDFRENLNCFH